MLGQLAREYFAASPLLAYPVFALFVFATLFAVLTWRALRVPQAERERLGSLPLENDDG